MSRPNLVLELSILKGLNQIRRNIGRVSSFYLDTKELVETTWDLDFEEVRDLGPSSALVVKCSGPIKVTVERAGTTFDLDVQQLFVLDSPTDRVLVQNMQTDPVQVIVVKCSL